MTLAHKRVIFHIGDAKTGSTSIQMTLKRLSQQENPQLSYPEGANSNPLAHTFYQSAVKQDQGRLFKEMVQSLESQAPAVAVISAEHFESVRPDEFRAMLEHYMPWCLENAHIVAYVRPHAARLLSTFSQQIKTGSQVQTLQQFFELPKVREKLHYAPRFLRWRQVFGDQFTLRPMITTQLAGGDVARDFLDFVFQGQPYQMPELSQSNKSPSLEDLSVLSVLHQGLRKNGIEGVRGRRLGGALAHILARNSSATATGLMLHKELTLALIEGFKADAAELDREFFKEPLMLEALLDTEAIAVALPQSLQLETHFPTETRRLINAFASLIAQRHNKRRQAKNK